jgi:hypothetical protein
MMAFSRTKQPIGTDVAVITEASTALIASATRITVAEAENPTHRYTDEAWQREAWGFYDCNGELHYAADYVGSALSLVRIMICHVDENGVRQGEVLDDPEVSAIAETMLGGPAMKSEILGNLGTSLTVAGETYLIGRSGGPLGDQWFTVAPQYIRRWGGKVKVDFGAGVWEEINPSRDVVMRIWTPHAARPLLADSPARALLLSFNQLMKLRMFMSSELNSRIANGSLYPLPDDLKFPGDAANNIPAGAPGVAQLIFEAMTTNISGFGTAAAIAPIIFEAPPASIAVMKDQPIRFDAPLSDHAMDYRKELIEDVARGMNVPAGQMSSTAMQGMNHWSAWWGTEEFTTKTVAPMMNRISGAFNIAYLYAALKKLGRDPKRFTVWYDLAPLSNSANQLVDTLNLYRENPELVSADEVRRAGNYNDASKPTKKDVDLRNMWEVVKRDPTLLQSEGVRKFLGLDIPDFVPALTGIEPGDINEPGPAPPPVPDGAPSAQPVGSKPVQKAVTDKDSNLIASMVASPSPLVATAHAVVLAALAVAGRKLRTPPYRIMFRDVPPAIMHTRIKVNDREHADNLLASAWATAEDSFDDLSVDTSKVLPLLHDYTASLLVNEVEHSRGLLAGFLAARGVS